MSRCANCGKKLKVVFPFPEEPYDRLCRSCEAERSGVAQPCPPSATGCPGAGADGQAVADSSGRCPEVNGFPALPCGFTRTEIIEGLRELRDTAVAAVKTQEPDFVRWPDLDAILDYIEQHGFPAPENAGQCNGQRVLPDNEKLRQDAPANPKS